MKTLRGERILRHRMRPNPLLFQIGIACAMVPMTAHLAWGAARPVPPPTPGTIVSLPPVIVLANPVRDSSLPVYTAEQVTTQPRALDQPTQYPRAGGDVFWRVFAARIGGNVRMSFVVDETGAVHDIVALGGTVFDATGMKRAEMDSHFSTKKPVERELVDQLVAVGAIPASANDLTIDEVRTRIVAEFGRYWAANVARWRFQPGRLRGKPVAVRMEAEYGIYPPTTLTSGVRDLPGIPIKLQDSGATASSDSVVVPLADVDRQPRPVSTKGPKFPPLMQHNGILARVKVTFVVDETGATRDVHAVESVLLDDKRKTAVERPLLEAMVKRGALPPATLERPLEQTRGSLAMEFGKAAELTVQLWKYRPAQDGGKPVAVRLETTVVFNNN